MRKLIVLLVLLFALGCTCVSKDVVLLAVDTSNVQNDTSDALISSINEDIKTGNRTPEQTAELINLRDRLDYLKRANRALFLSLTKNVTMEELAEILKESNKFNNNKENVK